MKLLAITSKKGLGMTMRKILIKEILFVKKLGLLYKFLINNSNSDGIVTLYLVVFMGRPKQDILKFYYSFWKNFIL